MNKIIGYFIFYGLILTFASCTSSKPECINDNNNELTLRWGYFLTKTGNIAGYQLNNDATLHKILKTELVKNNTDSVLFRIDEDRYCKFLLMTRDTILKIQALNEPGDSLHFIEYADPPRKVRMRAVWNPINKTYGSRGFRLIYDSLQALVPVVR